MSYRNKIHQQQRPARRLELALTGTLDLCHYGPSPEHEFNDREPDRRDTKKRDAPSQQVARN